MTKIYETLEHARRELHEVRQTAERAPETPGEERSEHRQAEAAKVPLAPIAGKLSLEKEMTALYQSVNSLLPDLNHRVLQFISARSGEGTSTVIRELAKVITTLMGRSVLLLDIDRKSPSLLSFYDCTSPVELDEVVNGTLPISQAICQVEDTSLFVSPLFQHSVLTPQRLGSQSTDVIWDQLRERFEYVLIDSPPVSASSDGLAIVRKVDGVILVIEAEKTRRPVALAARQKIVSHGGNILGMVFNKRRFYIPEAVYKRM